MASTLPSGGPATGASPRDSSGPSASPPANPVNPAANPTSPAVHHQPIAVDDELGSDGPYESSNGTDTTSLSSTVFDYQYENGRRYHAFREGRYALPNDEKEQDRLDMIHHMYSIIMDGVLVAAPVENPQRILDIGTGTGIWAIDVADEFPSAVVIGTDLSPIQPSWIPPNCKFEVDDAESDWSSSRNSFDLVHSRHLMTSIKNWPVYIRQIYKSLNPGGWVQILEHDSTLVSDDDSIPSGSCFREWFDLYNVATEKTGRPTITHKLAGMLEEAGFAEVNEKIYALPFGPWAKDKKLKEVGAWALANTETSFEAYGLAFMTRVLEKDPEEAKKICHKAHEELRSKKVHVYNKHYLITARKPFEPGTPA